MSIRLERTDSRIGPPLEERIAALEDQVSSLGEYVADQVEPSRTKAKMETHLEAATFDKSAGAVDLADSAAPRLFGRDEAQIQRSLEGTDTTIDDVPGKVLDVLSNGGQPLDQPVQRALEERMDADFSDVRIHTGGTAAKAAEAIDAKAFTCGNDIVFNSGEYDPESPEGQHLLAHELAHVTQQNGGAPISMMPQEGADLEIDPDPQLEREADEAAAQALSGEEPLVVNRLGTDVHVQRSVKGALSSVAERVPGISGADQDQDQDSDDGLEFQELDDGDLAETVGTLVENQQKLISQIQSGKTRQSLTKRLGKATGKGAIGAVGGLVGAAAGTLIAPGVGTAGGAVAGQQVVSELASGIASDVSKAAYDPVFESGSNAIAQQSSDFSSYIEKLVDEKIRQRFGGSGHGGLEGVGKAGEVTK